MTDDSDGRTLVFISMCLYPCVYICVLIYVPSFMCVHIGHTNRDREREPNQSNCAQEIDLCIREWELLECVH